MKLMGGIVITVAALWIGAVFLLLSLRKDWVAPMEGVRLTPARQVLRMENVADGSTFDLLLQAADLSHITQREFSRLVQMHSYHIDWLEGPPASVRKAVEAAQPNFELIRRAAALPHPQIALPRATETIPYIEGIRQLGRLLIASAYCHAAEDSLSDAWNDLKLSIALGSLCSHGGGLLHYSIGAAMSSQTCQALWNIAMHTGMPSELKVKIIEDLKNLEASYGTFAEALRHDLIGSEEAIDLLYDGKVPESGRIKMTLFSFFTSRAAMKDDYRAVYSQLIHLAEEPYDRAALEAFMTGMEPVPGRNPLARKNPVGMILAGTQAQVMARMFTRGNNHKAILRGMRLFLAVQAYERQHGRLPAALPELVPDYLRHIPQDPFDNLEMKYLHRDDGAWAVYSVGEDTVDDRARGRSWGAGKDIVIPGTGDFLPTPPENEALFQEMKLFGKTKNTEATTTD